MVDEVDPEVIPKCVVVLLQELIDELVILNTQLAKLSFTGVNSVLTIHETTPT